MFSWYNSDKLPDGISDAGSQAYWFFPEQPRNFVEYKAQPCGMEAVFKRYFRKDSALCSPARQKDYSSLPLSYTFVGDQEPFYCETLAYIENLKKEGVPAHVDVYPTGFHAFNMLLPFCRISRQAITEFEKRYLYAAEHYRAAQKDWAFPFYQNSGRSFLLYVEQRRFPIRPNGRNGRCSRKYCRSTIYVHRRSVAIMWMGNKQPVYIWKSILRQAFYGYIKDGFSIIVHISVSTEKCIICTVFMQWRCSRCSLCRFSQLHYDLCYLPFFCILYFCIFHFSLRNIKTYTNYTKRWKRLSCKGFRHQVPTPNLHPKLHQLHLKTTPSEEEKPTVQIYFLF